MTTIVELQAQLGQSHLKVEQLLKQKLELMALCQDHHHPSTTEVDNHADVTNRTSRPSARSSLIIRSPEEHDDDKGNSRSDGVAADRITTSSGARINASSATTQTILDEVKGMKSLIYISLLGLPQNGFGGVPSLHASARARIHIHFKFKTQ